MSEAAPRPETEPHLTAPAPPPPGSSFEDATRRLAQIVAELEGGELPLDRSLALFEEGVRLAHAAEDRLDRAERRIEELLGIDAKGAPVVRELESVTMGDLPPTHAPRARG
jgi:exodeoxyribonuclease VII small subunit